MTAGRSCSRVVASASAQETIRTAAERMAATDVGALVVLDVDGATPIGIVTDRDLVVRCTAVRLEADRNEIGAIMSRPVHWVNEQTPIEEALERMARAGVRRLVVVGDTGRLVGLLSLDDALDVLAGEVSAIRNVLAKQRNQIPEGFCLR